MGRVQERNTKEGTGASPLSGRAERADDQGSLQAPVAHWHWQGTERGSSLSPRQGPPQQPTPPCPRDTLSLAPLSSLRAHPIPSRLAHHRKQATPTVGLETGFIWTIGVMGLASLLFSPLLFAPMSLSEPRQGLPIVADVVGNLGPSAFLPIPFPTCDGGGRGGVGLGLCGTSRCLWLRAMS